MTHAAANDELAVSLASEVIHRFKMTDLIQLLSSIEAHSKKQTLNLAVFGRFKAGKSSFLNHLIGRSILPVGVLPVTAVITEIEYGARERVDVLLSDGTAIEASSPEIADFATEQRNPENIKAVAALRLYVPALQRLPGIRLIDTPGLESIFSHNTQTSLAWTPNVDLAVVAIGVDPPLTKQDVELIERLSKFTPKIAVLLTKVDILDITGRREVIQFIAAQLAKRFDTDISIFPFSAMAGYEDLQASFEQEYIQSNIASFQQNRNEILKRKLQTLLLAVEDYLYLAVKAAEDREITKEALAVSVKNLQQSLADHKLQLQLIAKHAAGQTRSHIARYFDQKVLGQLQTKLRKQLEADFAAWDGSFSEVLAQFEVWLRTVLPQELTSISSDGRASFLKSLTQVERQCRERIQEFREGLSQRTLQLFGVPLRVTEPEIQVQPPRSPDVMIGKVFDHNWELVSFAIPMLLVRNIVKAHFFKRMDWEIEKNLSRLTSQWGEAINAAIFCTAHEGAIRLDDCLQTIIGLLSAESTKHSETTRSYLNRLRDAIASL